MEPYCPLCVTRFTQQRIPYMLKCCHLLCSECLVLPAFSLTGNCPLCQEPTGQTLAPAFDVLDLIEVLRKGNEVFPPSLWPTINKANVLCWGVLTGACRNQDSACLFQHDQAMAGTVWNSLQSILSSEQGTITSSGWRCRCGQEHAFETACQFCLQSLSLG